MSVKAQIVSLMDLIPDRDLKTLLEVVRRFVPADADDKATPDDIEAHERAMQEYRAGETIDHEAINWN